MALDYEMQVKLDLVFNNMVGDVHIYTLLIFPNYTTAAT